MPDDIMGKFYDDDISLSLAMKDFGKWAGRTAYGCTKSSKKWGARHFSQGQRPTYSNSFRRLCSPAYYGFHVIRTLLRVVIPPIAQTG